MFYSRMKSYPVSSPSTTDDGYGYEETTYTSAGTAYVYITDLDASKYIANDLDLMKYQYIGYTQSNSIDEGWLIDGKYKVGRVVPCRNHNVLYLSAIGESKGV